jgi:TonB family protein
MKSSMLLILFSLAVMCVSAQTAPLSPALQEAQKISAEVVKLFQQKKYDEAAPLAQKAITIRETELGKHHVSVAQAWRNLAYIQLQRERQKEAEKAFENAFEIFERNQPLSTADEKMFTEMLEAIAVYEANSGDLIGAEKKFERAIGLREKVNGKEAPEIADSLLKLAQIYRLADDYEKAAPLLLRALDIKTKKTGKLDQQANEIYSNAYCALSKLNREQEQTQLRERFYSSDSGLPKSVKGGVLNGRALVLEKPAYPAEARQKRAAGAVVVQVTIDENGKVIFACALSGARALHRASEYAAYRSKFSPTTLNGQTVKVSGIITYNFVP